MPSTTSAPECPICLDKFRNPVAPPCGHLACDSCITVHARQSPNPYQATCPTCRAPFPTVLVDLSVIPKKYHVFVSQPLRRVYLGNWEDSNSQTSIDDLRLENATLNAHIVALRCENEIISRQLLATQGSFSRLIAVERDARSTIDELTEDLEEAHLALDEANEEAMLALEEAEEKERRANAKLAKLRAEYDALKAG
ncbi:hypothetical protein F5148DRAFT_987247 [Russula earlei]|uniref:Uncharacterized protein n=1 Tax=Russula earlei TaxID=71964 RepID=A0ACC0TVH5_9AGAM|nr:hypothetical protein F5148DRAFT_987247 [Russula earlei]